MKEEVGMKRRGALGALAGWVVVGVLAFSSPAAFGQEDIYENAGGLTSALGTGAQFIVGGAPATVGFNWANATYNPNGVGQYLFGTYYDVRPVEGDGQVVNIAIVNTNSNNPNLPSCTLADVLQGRDGENCFFSQSPTSGLPKGGILAKVRFRESRFSSEVLDFNIALSCGEVWTGRVQTGGDDELPRLFSASPIVTNAGGDFFAGGSLITRPAFNTDLGGSLGVFRFSGQAPGSLEPADGQRGYMEVIGIADLPCEPDEGEIDLQNGNTWTILPNSFTSTNALAAEAFLVRVASGVSFGYPFEAISRYRHILSPEGLNFGTGIDVGQIFANETPNIDNCLGFTLGFAPFTGFPSCVEQFNLAFKKGRLIGQYDISPGTAGKTNLVILQPTKYRNCGGGMGTTRLYQTTPFSCAGPVLGGEEVTCTVYDRLENLAEGGFTSPSETERCFLPRELTIFGLPGSINADDILATPSTAQTPAGWVAIQLDEDINGQILHREIFPDPAMHDILGGYVQGYRGLPVVGLRLQEYENGNVGGTYGAIIKMQADDPVLFLGQS